ncbi:MAG TPA: hypothetical protein VFX85_03760 [Solirubrobacterales bacterium]|nr:hypothetical protein [Solirubrobacterales bacterium]
MGEWLNRRGEALVDAFAVFVVVNWLGPLALAAVLYLFSSVAGTFALMFAALWMARSTIKKMPVSKCYFPRSPKSAAFPA